MRDASQGESLVFQRIIFAVPAPTWLGFVVSMFSVFVGWVFGFNVTILFLVLFVLACIVLYSNYKLPAYNSFLVVTLFWIGHAPYLIVHHLL